MSSSDTIDTGSASRYSGGVAEVLDERLFSQYLNWAPRYIAQTFEKLKGVSVGI